MPFSCIRRLSAGSRSAGALITLAKYYLEARLTEHVIEAAETVLKKDPRHPQANALKIAAQAVTEEAIPSVFPKPRRWKEFPAEPDVAILLATCMVNNGAIGKRRPR